MNERLAAQSLKELAERLREANGKIQPFNSDAEDAKGIIVDVARALEAEPAMSALKAKTDILGEGLLKVGEGIKAAKIGDASKRALLQMVGTCVFIVDEIDAALGEGGTA